MSGPMRLDRLLANLGYGSRREVQGLVQAGRVRLGDEVLARADGKIRYESAARLAIDGTPLDPPPGLVVMMNKPVGTTCSRGEAGPLVYDLLPARWVRRDPAISSAGRLDKATSGLLLLTDDGALLHRIIAPKKHVPKCYRATLARPLRGDEGARFAAGTLVLDGETKPLLPASLTIVGPTEVEILVEEGRYHQVRRMFAALGNHVETLHRQRIGGLALPADLARGDYRVLAPEEIASVFEPRPSR